MIALLEGGAYKALAAPVLMLKPPAGPLAERINDILRGGEKPFD